jgi:predicted RNA binding protein YcfA (HicA-like mRNA interferase family)
MPLSGKELLRRYLRAGWILTHVKGSHHQLEKDGQRETIPVHGNQDLAKGLERWLLKRLEEV